MRRATFGPTNVPLLPEPSNAGSPVSAAQRRRMSDKTASGLGLGWSKGYLGSVYRAKAGSPPPGIAPRRRSALTRRNVLVWLLLGPGQRVLLLLSVFTLGILISPYISSPDEGITSFTDPNESKYAPVKSWALVDFVLGTSRKEAARLQKAQAILDRVLQPIEGEEEPAIPSLTSRERDSVLPVLPPSSEPIDDYILDGNGLLYFPNIPSEVDPSIEDAAHAQRSFQTAANNPANIRHPILYLIERAEREWDSLLSRQSKSLSEAVTEYRRRYKRAPPRGFDRWYRFAIARDVILIDEYDNIQRDIEPFQALPAHTLRKRSDELSGDRSSPFSQSLFTIRIRQGEIKAVTGPERQHSRAEDQAGLMEPFVDGLPDLDINYSVHDGPSILIPGEARQRHLLTARTGSKLAPLHADDVHDTADFPGWHRACAVGAPLRKALMGTSDSQAFMQSPSFIWQHERAMDLCLHPEQQYKHGFTAWQGPGPARLYPLFSFSKTSMHSDLLATPLEQFGSRVGDDPPWDEKPYDSMLWRGSSTGADHSKGTLWKSSQRARLVALGMDGSRNATLRWADGSGRLRQTVASSHALNTAFLDVAFAGEPTQCNHGDGTCAILKRDYRFEDSMGPSEANLYKFVFDTDGNGWSGRFHRLMSSNALVLKSTIFPEWYNGRIMPWYHYIPVKVDLEDVYDIMAFFTGDLSGNDHHEALAQQIAAQGKAWAEQHWRMEDMQAYTYRLLLEYARVMNHDPQDPTSWDFEL
ncbi:glycosyltransferase family 90 protein [Mixia osmundae IAM 14324]|uniref:Glycosyl transferase CAP10 domain-containing protein n=1 Tax=Mixia osmundae (strain CBS 9802 / IAM 14324 / JCM 22182 / KY 12970) TaxID=764103 RepID=G7E5E5_MIXOS|nr:glycosyltransferase family 90 protein [Mixia osmundae IAM 14324]KEI40794.1 glycosyltransferase family 90 protein [Mixia osmundae IAM 14324]GAA98055.1 hypothetical protein E5Q_04736 [Mixia osmundae IAM 14324]